jgi:mono/diheme cytochrome c family protein
MNARGCCGARRREGGPARRPGRARIAHSAAALAAAALALALTGCERTMRDMYAQPRLGPDAASPLFADGKGSRPPPPGSLPCAEGDLAQTSGGRRGAAEVAERAAADAAARLPPLTQALLARGRERFDIYCAPCHSPLGDGDGLVVRHGFPRPPAFDEARLRAADDRHYFDVISQGYGVMPSYADRVTPQDRWAIVAYVRALQLSQRTAASDLPPAGRAALAALAPASASRPPGDGTDAASPVAPPTRATLAASRPEEPR